MLLIDRNPSVRVTKYLSVTLACLIHSCKLLPCFPPNSYVFPGPSFNSAFLLAWSSFEVLKVFLSGLYIIGHNFHPNQNTLNLLSQYNLSVQIRILFFVILNLVVFLLPTSTYQMPPAVYKDGIPVMAFYCCLFLVSRMWSYSDIGKKNNSIELIKLTIYLSLMFVLSKTFLSQPVS